MLPTLEPLVQLMAHGPGKVVPSALEPFRSKSDAARDQPPPLTRVGGLPVGEPTALPLLVQRRPAGALGQHDGVGRAVGRVADPRLRVAGQEAELRLASLGIWPG